MARKPTISPTKIATYLACPVKYRWTYKDNRGRWYLRAKSYYSFGSSLHRVLEQFHASGDIGVATTSQLASALEENWIEAGYSSAEEMTDAFGEGLAILERHVQDHRDKSTTARTLYVEKQLKLDFDDFVLLGRVDRVDECEDGALEIVDYKSGRSEVAEEELRYDIAMSVYQLLLKRKHPDRMVRAKILALQTGRSATVSLNDHELEEFEAAVDQIGREIITEDFYERAPVLKPLCTGCDFLPLCRHDPILS